MNIRPYLQFNRNLSSHLTALLVKSPVTPNMVTTLGLLCGVAAGWMMAGSTRGAMIAGAALLHASFILDNCDGELARLKGQSTVFGRWFDMISDVTVDFALWVGLGVGAMARTESVVWVWAGALTGVGSLINFGMVIYERAHGHSTSIHIRKEAAPEIQNSTLHSLIETLCHNGDVIALVWILAIVGSPGAFLVLGSIYIHSIWIFRCMRYFPKLPKLFLRIGGTCVGIYLLYLASQGISWEEIFRLIRNTGPAALLTLLVFPVVSLFHAAGFYWLLRKETGRSIPFWRIYRIYFFGDTMNKITPFVDVGGEPLKIAMLVNKNIASMQESLRAAWMTRILFVASEAVYLVPAVVLLAIYFPSQEFVLIGMIGIVSSIIFAIFLFYLKHKTVGKTAVESPGGLSDGAIAFLWHFLGWVAFSIEVWVILWVLGVPASFLKVFLAQALLQAITSVTFFIPGSIGAQEGGLALLMKLMGFSHETGIALSLFKRARQLVWAPIGLAYYALSRNRENFKAAGSTTGRV